MTTLPAVIVTLLLPFEHLFDRRTWRKAQRLVVGAILLEPGPPAHCGGAGSERTYGARPLGEPTAQVGCTVDDGGRYGGGQAWCFGNWKNDGRLPGDHALSRGLSRLVRSHGPER